MVLFFFVLNGVGIELSSFEAPRESNILYIIARIFWGPPDVQVE